MYVIYYGVGNTLSPSLAAILHVKGLPSESLSSDEILPYLPHLVHLEKISLGRVLFIGRDEEGHEILLLNTGYAETIILPSLLSVFDILQASTHQLLLVDMTTTHHFLMKYGFFLYRFSLTRRLGQGLLLKGIEHHRKHLHLTVEGTKKKLRERRGGF